MSCVAAGLAAGWVRVASRCCEHEAAGKAVRDSGNVMQAHPKIVPSNGAISSQPGYCSSPLVLSKLNVCTIISAKPAYESLIQAATAKSQSALKVKLLLYKLLLMITDSLNE